MEINDGKERIVVDCKTSTKILFNEIKAKLLRYKVKNNEDALLWLIHHSEATIKFR